MESFLELTEENTLGLLEDVIHKIKNSLGGIGGFAALLERDLGPDDPRTALSLRIQDGVIRTNDVVVNLMTFLQKPELSFDRINPVSVIQQTWSAFWEESDPPANVLQMPATGKTHALEWTVDPETFQELVLHAFRFARSAGGQINRVRIVPKTDRSVLFEVIFPATSSLQVDSTPGIQSIQTCEPIEVKLSLYIVMKMAKFNGAKVSLLSHAPNQHVLSIEFSEGIPA